MQVTQLDALTYVGPQISVANMDDLRRLKIKTVIVARPEGETADQPDISAIREAADALGITIHQIPVVPGNVTSEDALAYATIIAGAGHPVFSYCRSGMRAASLWALRAAKQGQSPDEILHMAKTAGFDLSALTDQLTTKAA
ncbi:MAG: TIGR01244 family sulfur transferase [Amylibacter sp.]